MPLYTPLLPPREPRLGCAAGVLGCAAGVAGAAGGVLADVLAEALQGAASLLPVALESACEAAGALLSAEAVVGCLCALAADGWAAH